MSAESYAEQTPGRGDIQGQSLYNRSCYPPTTNFLSEIWVFLYKNTVQNRISIHNPDLGSIPAATILFALWNQISFFATLLLKHSQWDPFLLMHVFASITIFCWWSVVRVVELLFALKMAIWVFLALDTPSPLNFDFWQQKWIQVCSFLRAAE